MENRREFRARVAAALDRIGPDALSYDESEFWMIQSPYEYIEYYAVEKRLFYTAVALPLVRGLHDGIHRKSSAEKDGELYRLPYVIHPLLVTRMLVDLRIPVPPEEEDIILAGALCHDLIEDIPFPEHGRELTTVFGLDRRIYDAVKAVSKRRDFTEKEEQAFFRGIADNPAALLIKLSDRGHNVEDLYNMSFWKVHEYVEETRKYFLPLCTFGKEHYPQLCTVIEILEDKLLSLTNCAETLVDRYDEREKALMQRAAELREENVRLRGQWKVLWEDKGGAEQ